jgi:hypothetical protein
MSMKRDNNFNQNQIRGINLAVNATAKTYPFIKGWKLSKEYEKWSSGLYILLKVEWNEVSKFYKQEWRGRWKDIYDGGENLESSLIYSYMFEGPSNGDEDFESYIDESFKETKKINNLLNSMYHALPEELQIETTFYSMITNTNEKYSTELYIERFVTE